MSDVELVVNGNIYSGWESVSLTRSMEQFAHTFSLDYTDRWLASGKPLPINEGAECRVQYKGNPVVTGYVDDNNAQYDATSRTASIDGRSKTGDLVDCSAIHKTGSWRDAKFDVVARNLCEPFGITVEAAADVGTALRRFAIQQGESAYEALERAARMRGVLLFTSPTGNLAITRAGKVRTKTAIERGVNVIAGGRRGSWRERFSQYIFKSQIAGDNDFNGEHAAFIKVESKDAGISRYRPMLIIGEAQESKAELQKRADWERNVRRGRSLRLVYTVYGWTNAEGLWTPNTLAAVRDNVFDIDTELLIVSTRMLRDNNGTRTELELMAPESLSVEPPKPEKSAGEGFRLL